MKNLFLSAAIACTSLLTMSTASAQFNYTLTTLTDTYTPLTGATSVSNGSLWTSDSMFVLPIGFSVNMNGITTDTLYAMGGAYVMPKIAPITSGWAITGAGMSDRGIASGMPKSDVRYETTGVPGSRIFKMEVLSAGFETELFTYGDMKDSIDFQMWVYETSNIVEFRYGNSDVNYFSDYFGPRMIAGYVHNVDTATQTFSNFYLLNGTPSNPSIDSFVTNPFTKGLTDAPEAGRVYRFTPPPSNPTGIKQVAAGTNATVFPTMAEGFLIIETGVSKPVTYTVMSSNGQLMTQDVAKAGRTKVDISGYAPGLYTVSVLTGDNSYEVHKMVKMP